MVLADFLAMAKSVLTLVTDGIQVFMSPPLVWFVALAATVAGIKVAKSLIPKKKG